MRLSHTVSSVWAPTAGSGAGGVSLRIRARRALPSLSRGADRFSLGSLVLGALVVRFFCCGKLGEDTFLAAFRDLQHSRQNRHRLHSGTDLFLTATAGASPARSVVWTAGWYGDALVVVSRRPSFVVVVVERPLAHMRGRRWLARGVGAQPPGAS